MTSRIGAVREREYTVNRRRYVAVAERAYSFRAIPTTILDAHFIVNILSDVYSYLPSGRYSMTDQENQGGKTLDEEIYKLSHDTAKQLIIYAFQAFASLAIFALFVVTVIGADRLCSIWPQISIMVMIKVVAWIISALGAICCIGLVVRNTIVFIKFLLKGPPQGTSGPKVAGEGRIE